MRAALFVVAFCLVATWTTAAAQVESACLLTIPSSMMDNLDDTKVQDTLKSSVFAIAGDFEVILHQGKDEAAIQY